MIHFLPLALSLKLIAGDITPYPFEEFPLYGDFVDMTDETDALVELMNGWLTPIHEGDQARYRAIAEDVLDVVADPRETPLFSFEHDDDEELARFHTAVQILAVARDEGGYQAQVDSGKKRGDNGEAVCMLQVHPGPGVKLTPEGFQYSRLGIHAKDLVHDRKLCIRVGLHFMRESFARCGKYGENALLTAYTSGECLPSERNSAKYIRRAKDVRKSSFQYTQERTP